MKFYYSSPLKWRRNIHLYFSLNPAYVEGSKYILSYKKKIEKLSESERGLGDQKNNVEEARKNYQLYLKKFEEARISDAMDSEKITSVSVIENAQVPFKPVSPNVLLNLFSYWLFQK